VVTDRWRNQLMPSSRLSADPTVTTALTAKFTLPALPAGTYRFDGDA